MTFIKGYMPWNKGNEKYTKEELKELHREYYKKHKDRWKIYNRNGTENHRKWHAKRRLLCLNHYGSKCACCGEKQIEFLSIDHVNNDGWKHRKKLKTTIYSWLIQNHFPKGFQVLCMNCNCAKSWHGQCPHRLL